MWYNYYQVIYVGLVDSVIDACRFKDTVFYKDNSDLYNKYNALKKLNEEFPNNEELQSELYIVKRFGWRKRY